jgi:hypothetical protein
MRDGFRFNKNLEYLSKAGDDDIFQRPQKSFVA